MEQASTSLPPATALESAFLTRYCEISHVLLAQHALARWQGGVKDMAHCIRKAAFRLDWVATALEENT